MITIITKNVSGISLVIKDLGVTLGIGEVRNLTDDFDDIATITSSKYLKQFVIDSKIVINNGEFDLPVAEGLEHISLETEYSDKTSPTIIGLSSFQCYDNNLPYNISSTSIPILFNLTDLPSGYCSLNNGKITLLETGIYEIYYHINWLASRNTCIKSSIRVNGSTFLPRGIAYSSSTTYGTNKAKIDFGFTVGDYFEVVCVNLDTKWEASTLQNESYLILQYLRGG